MSIARHNYIGHETATKSTEQQTLQLAPRLRPSCAGFTFEGRVGFAMEEWKPVVGFEGRYEVSTFGRVRALFNTINKRYKAGRILKPLHAHDGYVRVALFKHFGCKAKYRSIHSLVLEAFKGPRPTGSQSRHLDGNTGNNSVDNLKWGTASENAQDAMRHGTFIFGENNPFSKLTNAQVIEIRKLRDSGVPCAAVGQQFSVSASTAWLIGKRKSWKHL